MYSIKGGFPNITICNDDIIKNIKILNPREFNNNNIISIKKIINNDSFNDLIDLINEPNIFIKEDTDEFKIRRINNIDLNLITSKFTNNTKKSK
jgi:hypothetical protein